MVACGVCCRFFFFKQKTAYEMRISDWSSDACSSDLACAASARGVPPRRSGPKRARSHLAGVEVVGERPATGAQARLEAGLRRLELDRLGRGQIGRASCRDSVCQYV